MAQAKMPDAAELVRKVYWQFPPDSHDKTGELLMTKDYHGLFSHLEDLISSRVLDDVLKGNDGFRSLMGEVYGPRYPWLKYADLGAALWEEEQDREEEFIRQEVRRLGPAQLAATMADYDHDHEAVRLALGQKMDNRSSFLPQPSKDHEVPLAPTAGGPAPREPFPTEWTYRPTPEGTEPTYDPKTTWKHFVVGNRPSQDDIGAETTSSHVLAKHTVAQLDSEKENENEADKADEDDGIPKDWNSLPKHRDWNPNRFTTLDKILAPLPGGKPKTKARLDWEAEKMLEELCLLMKDIGLDSGKLKSSHVDKMLPEMRKMAEVRHPMVRGKEPVQQSKAAEGSSPHPEEPHTKAVYAKALLRRFGIRKTILDISSKETTPGNQGDVEMDDTGHHGTGDAPGHVDDVEMIDANVPSSTELPGPTAPELYDENWLINWLKDKGEAKSQDLKMMEYRGWRIHSPKIQLIRIKNFLADEDIDRTLGWKGHFAEIAVYLQHLLSVYKDEDWGWDLKEATLMLRTHWLYEQHHYGVRKLNLGFSEPVVFPQRLKAPTSVPPVAVADITSGDVQGNARPKPRYLLHRNPESVHDVDYQVPANILHSHFYLWYRQDDTRLWDIDVDDPLDPKPELVGSGQRGWTYRYFGYQPDFNMSHVADLQYVKCMALGPSETSRALRQEANFYLSNKDWVDKADGETIPDGHSARRFAAYRGAKRAALQQVLTHFNNDENIALANAFRRLVLPIPIRERERAEEEARKQIVYKPLALMQPPSGEKLDPLGFVYWHSHLLANHAKRAERARPLVERGHRERMKGSMQDGEPVTLPSANFLGPYKPSYLAGQEETQLALLKKLKGIRDLLKTAQRRAPRELLEQVLAHWDMGTKMEEPKDKAVTDELRRQSEVLKERGEAREHKEISERDLYWMRFLAGPSTNDALLDESRAYVPENRRMEVFAERIQALLADPWSGGVLANANVRRSVAEMKKAVNTIGTHGGTKPDMIYFVAQEVVYHGKLLADAGRLGFRQKGDEVTFSRPKYKYHPEMRIDWYSFKCPKSPDLDTLPPPATTPPLGWETAIAVAKHEKEVLKKDGDAATKGPSSAEVTALAFKIVAWRMGAAEAEARRTINETYERLVMEGAGGGGGSTFTAAVDSHRLQLYDMQDVWTDEVFCERAESGGPPVKYAAVARAAYPALFRGTDKLPLRGDVHHGEAVETVRAGLIRELSEAKNMLWPARQRFRPGEKTVMTLQREPVWEWARPGWRGMRRAPRRWFSLDRWPLHLQSPGRREEILKESETRSPLDADVVVSASGEASVSMSVPTEGHGAGHSGGSMSVATTMTKQTPAGDDVQVPFAGMDGPLTQTIQEVKKTVHGKRRRSSSAQSDEDSDLGQPIRNVLKPSGAFEPGRTGTLLADTPRKKAAIEDATVPLGQPEDDKGPGTTSWATSIWNPFRQSRETQPRRPPGYVGGPAIQLPAALPFEVPKSVPRSVASEWPLDVPGSDEEEQDGAEDGGGPAKKKVRLLVGAKAKSAKAKREDKKWNVQKVTGMWRRRQYSKHVANLLGHDDLGNAIMLALSGSRDDWLGKRDREKARESSLEEEGLGDSVVTFDVVGAGVSADLIERTADFDPNGKDEDPPRLTHLTHHLQAPPKMGIDMHAHLLQHIPSLPTMTTTMSTIPPTMKSLAAPEACGPEKYKVLQLPVPAITHPKHVLVRTYAGAIVIGDCQMVSGQVPVGPKPDFPAKLGIQGAGVVAAVGSDVTAFKVGDAVYGHGFTRPLLADPLPGFCSEYALTKEHCLLPKPPHLSFEDAAAQPAAAVAAYQAFRRGMAMAGWDSLEGKTVYVPAALSVTGSAAIYVAKNLLGAERVISTVSTPKLSLVDELLPSPNPHDGGPLVDQVIDYTAPGKLTDHVAPGSVDIMLNTQFDALRPGIPLVNPATGVIVSLASMPTADTLAGLVGGPDRVPFWMKWILGLAQYWYAFLLRGTNIHYAAVSGNPEIKEDLDVIGEAIARGKIKSVKRVVDLADVEGCDIHHLWVVCVAPPPVLVSGLPVFMSMKFSSTHAQPALNHHNPDLRLNSHLSRTSSPNRLPLATQQTNKKETAPPSSGTMVKRKRSCSELSSSTSCFSSPSRPDRMVTDSSPVSPVVAMSSRYFTPPHLPSRTMKRVRDNRPSEEEIHERTLNMLFSAQRPRQPDYPTAVGPPSPSPSPTPEMSHTHHPTTTRPTQRSLHSFWRINSTPRPSVSSPEPHVDPYSLSSGTNCEDCGAGLGLSGDCDGGAAAMDVDGYGYGYGVEADCTCSACGKRVCSHCSVTNLGQQRRCLRCAGPKVGRAGLPWSSSVSSSVW
ncbi:hypothetical protein SODALDRAFT_358334 [Sodiomyces alkalinus F11]|uniref:Enoyl reductase (ER) domain-containing protein n=1 Tax=Sodiomyces alkalinus (strain CBS 110278 / VKM F-3762 / F11) TaxID=1314773 RepID=A0A3N2PZQ5_SODAK|nr:hypothetical protein SODALDRAFT_358334 [Sodiomyces alkalinus F11]ROT39918.1 hypothetical protein SODALDRAFT_358334 [Sodiomyces alkalinus F11]